MIKSREKTGAFFRVYVFAVQCEDVFLVKLQ